MIVKVETLKDHPLNAKLYNEPKKETQEELVKSIRDKGLLEIIKVNSKNFILSGHRRVRAIKTLGWEEVDVVVEEHKDEEAIIIEYNRYRRKTMSEIMREAEKLMEIEVRKAENRRVLGGPPSEKGRAREKVARALDIGSGFQMAKMKKVWDAAKTSPQIAQKLMDIDDGKTSVDAVFKMLSPKRKEDVSGRGMDLQIYNLWYFIQPDPGLGMPHPGQIAGQVIENLLWYYTKPDDFFIDPFAGGGISIDASEIMRRECLALDISPVRDDVVQWDITKGYPPLDKEVSFVFADPPYWNMLNADYKKLSKDTVSDLSMHQFIEFLHKFSKDTFNVLKDGGFFALIIMPQVYGLPEGVPFIDWPFEARIAMDEAGFVPYRRIINRWPPSIWNAHQVEQAKGEKGILQVTGDIIIGRKP